MTKKLYVIVLVDHAVGISGPHRNVVGSLNALSKRDDLQVRLLCERIDEAEPYAKSGKIDIRLGFNPHRFSKCFSNLFKLQKAIQNYDLIYVPTGLKSFLYAQIILYGKPLVVGPNVTPLPICNSDCPGKSELYFMCDLWLEASKWRLNHVIKYSGVEKKVKVVHHAIDNDKFSPVHRSVKLWEKYGISINTIKVIFVIGKDYKLKGATQLIDAIEFINLQITNNKIDFILLGKLSDNNKQRITEFKNVHPLGFKTGDELAAIYASSDICTVPSTQENMPFVVLEAMASGLSVIASRTGGIPEQIESEVSGLLVDIVKDGVHIPDAGIILANAIFRLSADSELRKYLGKNARKRIVEYFCEGRLGAELSSIFREMANQE